MGWSNTAGSVLQATTVIVSGSGSDTGIFIYSPTPGTGNLIGAWTAAAGTDPYTNAFPAGLTIWDGSGHEIGSWSTSGFEILGPQGSGKILVQPVHSATTSPEFQLTSGPFPVGASPSEIMAVNGTLVAGQDCLTILGAAAPESVDSHVSAISLLLSAGGGANGAIGQLVFNGSATEVYAQIDHTGFNTTGFVTAPQPLSDPATPEGWHNLSLNSGFQQLAGFGVPRYELEGTNAGRTRLSGVVQLVGAQAQGATIATLSASYAPLVSKIFNTANNLSGGATNIESLQVHSTGTITLGVAGANGNYVSLDGICFENND